MAGKDPNFVFSKFPLENSLEKFASVNFIMSLGAISSTEMNFPDTSYKINGIKDGQLILRSGGFSTDDIGNKKPRIYAEGLYGIDTAYFIDDLNIEEVVSPTRRVRTTNSTNFSMKIHEPYSMGNFLQTLKLASFNAGYDNYLQAVYLLMIETIGYDDNGKVIRGETRHFPINIYDVQFDTSTQGSVYDLSAIPCNESALSDVYQCIKADITVSGKTVEEMLQSGLNSLATNINTNQLNNRVEKKKGEATVQADTDEYIVLFPKDSTSKSFQQFSSTFSNKAIEGDFAFKEFTLEQAFGTNGRFEQYPSTGFRIQGQDFSPSVEQQMTDYAKAQSGWSVKRSNLSEGIKQKFTGIQGEVNSIGRSKIQIEDPLSGNNKVPFGIPNFAYDQKTGIMKRGRTSINTTEKTIQFTKGTKIEKNVVVGPYARLREGTVLKENTKIGNFVETKKSNINKNSKVNHLSYIGDTSIGKNSNIGAGTITCNYDGIKKSKTNISDNVFVGSNSSLVAPINIDKNSVVGAGSVITKNVKKKSLAITRAPQIEIKNYKRKKK